MYNRFKFEKDFFKENYEIILKRLDNFRHNGYKKIFHVIVPGLDLEFMENHIFNMGDEFNPTTTFIYNKEVVYTKDTTLEFFDYIIDMEEETNVDANIMFYNQRVTGWTSNYPTANLVVNVDSNYDMVFDYDHKQKIGNFMDKIDFPKIMNIFLGDKKCSKCLNCLCDITKTKDSFFIIDRNECRKKTRIKATLPKEVTEVSKEEYITIIEYLSSINKNNQTDHNILADGISTIQETLGEMQTRAAIMEMKMVK
ncbi:MAG: hypothetical protein ACRC92_20120 [Peptostreptococcaceae bacterium]